MLTVQVMIVTLCRKKVLWPQAVSWRLTHWANARRCPHPQLHSTGRAQHRRGIQMGLPRTKGKNVLQEMESFWQNQNALHSWTIDRSEYRSVNIHIHRAFCPTASCVSVNLSLVWTFKDRKGKKNPENKYSIQLSSITASLCNLEVPAFPRFLHWQNNHILYIHNIQIHKRCSRQDFFHSLERHMLILDHVTLKKTKHLFTLKKIWNVK